MKPNTFTTPLRPYLGTPGLLASATSATSVPRVDPKDLEELIGSLGIDLYTPARSGDIVKSILDSDAKVCTIPIICHLIFLPTPFHNNQ